MNIKKISYWISDRISVWVLVALALLDVMLAYMMYCMQTYIWIPIVFYVIGIAVIWLSAKRTTHSLLTGLSPVILTKLLGNAIAPSKLGVTYLLVFVIHLGWLTDSTFNIISIDQQGIDISNLIPLYCSIGGLICIIGFFPDPYKKKNEKSTKVIISGMSVIGKKQWEGLKDALRNNDIEEVKKFSIIPLVRMLVLHSAEESCRLLILKSKDLATTGLSPICLKVEGGDKVSTLSLSSEGLYRIQEFKTDISTLTSYLNPSETNGEKEARAALYTKYGVANPLPLDSSEQNFEKFLTVQIKLFAHFEFPDKYEQIKKMDVEFTAKCNYNSYADCFDTLESAIQKYDNDENIIEFNITPGTALVSSVMTLLAIDGDKKLYYHEQDPRKPCKLEASDAIQEVDKTRLPIENLLSQALEKISGERA